MRYPSIICTHLTFFLLGLHIQNCTSISLLQRPAWTFSPRSHATKFWLSVTSWGIWMQSFSVWCCLPPKCFSVFSGVRRFFDAETRRATWTDVLRRAERLATLSRRKKKPIPQRGCNRDHWLLCLFPHFMATILKPILVCRQETHHLTLRWPLFFLWCNKMRSIHLIATPRSTVPAPFCQY